METWLPVVDFADLYEVSSLGRVRILVRRHNIREGSMLALSKDKDGYLYVRLSRNDGARVHSYRVNRITFEAFCGPIPPGFHVDHVNRVKDDNRPGNLEAITGGENQRRRGGLLGEKNHATKLTEELVLTIRQRAAAGDRFDHIARDVGISGVQAANVAYGKVWAHVGGPTLTPRGRIGRPPTSSRRS